MFGSVRGVWSALGVMLTLIALYLVLQNAAGATGIISSIAGASGSVFKVLQGRP